MFSIHDGFILEVQLLARTGISMDERLNENLGLM